MSEYLVRCLPALGTSGGDQELRLEINGTPVGVKLRIERLTENIVAGLPDRAFDLLEVAALVYGVDAAVRRGGSADQQMGNKWHRSFIVEMPVRDSAFWAQDEVSRSLEEMLFFLSGDRIKFQFLAKDEPEVERSRFFKFDRDSAWQATRVLMFSGGLDSLSGALEEIVDHGQHVALVSHFSASKIAPVQRDLQRSLRDKFGQEVCRHVPVQVQMTKRGLKEGTHRARSFLFATLGAITAQAFRLNRVSFHENGVVSLNLPPVGNVLGTRATRTTHPQTLTRFTELMSKVFDTGMRIDNPFFWRTKQDVVEGVARLGMASKIADTRSCADVHNQTKQYPHCGRCSQCIDRRFAVLAAGLQGVDPEEAYRVPLMEGARDGVIDREIALSYVRNAIAYENMRPEDLEQIFPAVLDAVDHLDQPASTALEMVAKLLKRHGSGVAGVIRQTVGQQGSENFPDGSLPHLFGDAQRSFALPAVKLAAPASTPPENRNLVLEVDEKRRSVVIAGLVTMNESATADLLIALAQDWLVSAGVGLTPLDFPFVQATALADRLSVASEEVVRRRVNRARRDLGARFEAAGLDRDTGEALIENQPWHGYRLKPDWVTVRKQQEPG